MNDEHDDDAYDQRLDAIAARVEAAYPDGVVVFSAGGEDEDGLPLDCLDQVAVEGTVVFTAAHDPFFGEGRDFRSEPITDPTWMQVVGIANLAVDCTGDEHHIYLEGIDETASGDGVRVFELVFGS